MTLDIGHFLLIFVYFTIIVFTLIYENIDKKEDSFNIIVLMSIGEVGDQKEDLFKWIAIGCGIIMNLIILLNLIISIA